MRRVGGRRKGWFFVSFGGFLEMNFVYSRFLFYGWKFLERSKKVEVGLGLNGRFWMECLYLCIVVRVGYRFGVGKVVLNGGSGGFRVEEGNSFS